MPAAWCKPELSDVHDPKGKTSETRKPCLCSSGCSRSISNVRDVIHGSKRHTDKGTIGSPKSLESSDIHNPITHQVVSTGSKCELKINTRCCDDSGSSKRGSTLVGTLRPGTPGPGDRLMEPVYSGRRSFSLSRTIPGEASVLGSSSISRLRRSLDAESQGFVCQKCGENFKNLEAIEAHHLSRHAVAALSARDSSKKIVELICQTGFSESENNFDHHIERVLKVHNMQRTLDEFEDYREMVKIKANKLSKKHPRCLADGNELLRFYGTTVACSLGMNNDSSLCTLEKCGLCHILRHGFLTKKDSNGFQGVFTSSTSKRALERIKLDEDDKHQRKALVVCRVIAGRVHKPLENLQEMEGESSFDSLAAKVDCHSNIEELYSLNSSALLRCFVVTCKPSKQSGEIINYI
ncbi:hypothetical protein DITRI_Ditri02bG0020700 [Diplodiscus trichospermus]